ncbi:Gamma-aminobutyric acid receptor subunit beta-like [Trichinella spiralis]|uniref:Gamma-aminobutyric acid receptor subunit beta-like n=1 Tax=Trichinella spiralis TaxID=6334 RepID=A0ABR3KJP3_TRISP
MAFRAMMLNDITCSDGTVPICNGTLGGCDQHPDSWIGGVKVVPYEEDSSVEMLSLIPYCCNASNVLVHGDTCRHSRLSSLGRLLTLATKPDEIMQGLSCQVTRNHNGRIYDVTLKVRSCRFEIEQECCNKYMFGYFLHNFWNKEKTA